MFINELKKEVGNELKIAADLMKSGSPQGYEYLRSTLTHALFFAHEDKTIFHLQHILGPMKQEVILAIANFDKNVIIEIGKKVEIIGKALVEGKEDNEILDMTTEIGLLIETTWRRVIQSPSGGFIKLSMPSIPI
jgi:hypothetical protein